MGIQDLQQDQPGSSGRECSAPNVTTEIATKGCQYDIMTIGSYEVPIWCKQGWLEPMDGIKGYITTDLPLNFHPAAIRGSAVFDTPNGRV